MYDIERMRMPVRYEHIELSWGDKGRGHPCHACLCAASEHPDISVFWVIMQMQKNSCGNGVSRYAKCPGLSGE